jgi:hypothetical protein
MELFQPKPRTPTMIRLLSTELRDPEVCANYIARGYRWIRRVPLKGPIRTITRELTVGFPVEIHRIRDMDCVRLNSLKGAAMVMRNCYFTHDICPR